MEDAMPSDKPRGYIVETIHGGTDWCIRDATPDDPEDCVFDKHDAAVAAVRENVQHARDGGGLCNWFDFSTEVKDK